MGISLGQKVIDKIRKKENKQGQKDQKNQWFDNCLTNYKSLDKSQRFSIDEKDFWKCLDDNTELTYFDAHYEYHLAWAARILARTKPSKHIDISSKLSFNTIVSAFIPIDFYDYRPARLYLDNLECKQADLCCLPFKDSSVESISCMSVVEHIGLGRYGDEIDPDGDLKAISELKRVLKKGGDLLYIVPVGSPRIQFNAHRIYSYEMVMEAFEDFKLMDYMLVPDNAMDVGTIQSPSKEATNCQKFACGCFWFRK